MSFNNPEVAAMSAICEILEGLPDAASRLRVMRWSFGRYSSEFKRPLPGDPGEQTSTASSTPAAASDPTTPVPATRPAPVVAAPRPVERTPVPAAPGVPPSAPPPLRQVSPAPPDDDIGQQISDLNDLFPSRKR